MIDLYCERVGLGLFAEPFNVLTNLVFLIAVWRSWTLGHHLNALSTGVWVLIVLLLSIGIGSTLYHTFATGWARLFDLVPILLFQLCYLWLYARRLQGFNFGGALGSVISYYAAAYLAQRFPAVLNGSLMYAPALILLASLGLFHFLERKRGRFLLLTASGVFIISLFFRTIDRAICSFMPIGTHFLWHLLNGAVLYLSMRALLLNGKKSAAVDATSGLV